MKRVLACVVSGLVFGVAVVCFAKWSLDFGSWTEAERIILLVCGTGGMVCGLMAAGAMVDMDRLDD